MIILHDPNTLLHETVELLGSKLRPALESPDRIRNIVTTVKDSHHDFRTVIASPDEEQAVLALAKNSHDLDYLEHIRTVHSNWVSNSLIHPSESVLPECFRFTTKATHGSNPPKPKDPFALAGYFAFDMSSGLSARSYTSILASANLAVQAVRHLQQESSSITVLTRPPGHHCNGTLAGGYCYMNNTSISISAFRESWTGTSVTRIAVLDLDFHHGNGTQDITWADPQVLYVSIHGEHEFPYYSGFSSETGPASPHPAHGLTRNFPLPTGSAFDPTYLTTLNEALRYIRSFNPDLVLVSLGFDTYHLDPLGNFKIETEDYRTMAKTVRGATRGAKAAILLEGGYVVEDLGKNLMSFLAGWDEAEG